MQQLHRLTGVGSGEQLHLTHQNSGLCWYAGALAQCLNMVSCYPGWQGCWSHSALKVKLMSLSTEQLGRKGRGSVHQSVTDCLCYKTWAFLQGELGLSLLKSTWDKCNSFIGPCPIHRTPNPLKKYWSFKCQRRTGGTGHGHLSPYLQGHCKIFLSLFLPPCLAESLEQICISHLFKKTINHESIWKVTPRKVSKKTKPGQRDRAGIRIQKEELEKEETIFVVLEQQLSCLLSLQLSCCCSWAR